MHSSRRAIALVLLVIGPLAAIFIGCHTALPLTREQIGQDPALIDHRVRLTYPDGYVILHKNWKIEYPHIIGEIDESGGVVPSDPVEGQPQSRRFNLDDATLIETYRLSGGKTAGVSMAALLGVVVAAGLIIIATSCPAVYVVQNGQPVIVGEAYPGAIFRALQRDDLLPLPGSPGSPLIVRLRNDNPEIQYTDSAKVVLVGHSRDERAMATPDGRPIVVQAGVTTPDAAHDLEGNDVKAMVAAVDGQIWQSDLEAAYRTSRRDVREGVVARFQSPAGTGPLALDLTAENTVWMSVVFERCFAMMGRSFGPITQIANRSDRARMASWRAREGVDLRVEIRRNGDWQEVAIVPTPGMAALRRMAVPLGIDSGDDIQVRVSAGFGFWRIGSLALTRITDASPATTVIDASSATGSRDAMSLVAKADQRYHVMKSTGDMVDLTFHVPASPSERGSLFLATSGYYNAKAPRIPVPDLAALGTLRATEGSLATFGLDLYAENHARLREGGGR